MGVNLLFSNKNSLILSFVLLNVLVTIYCMYQTSDYFKIYKKSPSILPRTVEPIRPPTLVIYVYAEVDSTKTNNLLYFLDKGLCENCTNIDFAIIINGNTSTEIPQHKNVQVLYRANECGDFGAWDQLFREMDPEKLKKYKRIMFINDTVRGPFVDPNYLLLMPLGFHFTDIFAARLTNATRMVGSYINCGTIWLEDTVGFSHVQTMSFMMDDVAFNLSRPLIKCYSDHWETVLDGEIGISRNLLENNINIGSVMYAYKGIDFRNDEEQRTKCNNLTNASMKENGYFGMSVSPYEVIFMKNSNPYWDQQIEFYSQWEKHAPLV